MMYLVESHWGVACLLAFQMIPCQRVKLRERGENSKLTNVNNIMTIQKIYTSAQLLKDIRIELKGMND